MIRTGWHVMDNDDSYFGIFDENEQFHPLGFKDDDNIVTYLNDNGERIYVESSENPQNINNFVIFVFAESPENKEAYTWLFDNCHLNISSIIFNGMEDTIECSEYYCDQETNLILFELNGGDFSAGCALLDDDFWDTGIHGYVACDKTLIQASPDDYIEISASGYGVFAVWLELIAGFNPFIL